MLHDRGDAHRRGSRGGSGPPPSSGVGQCSPGAGAAPRSAASRDIGPAGSAAGGRAGSIVTGTGDGGSPVPGELAVPGPVCRETTSPTEVAAGGVTGNGSSGRDGVAGVLHPGASL